MSQVALSTPAPLTMGARKGFRPARDVEDLFRSGGHVVLHALASIEGYMAAPVQSSLLKLALLGFTRRTKKSDSSFSDLILEWHRLLIIMGGRAGDNNEKIAATLHFHDHTIRRFIFEETEPRHRGRLIACLTLLLAHEIEKSGGILLTPNQMTRRAIEAMDFITPIMNLVRAINDGDAARIASLVSNLGAFSDGAGANFETNKIIKALIRNGVTLSGSTTHLNFDCGFETHQFYGSIMESATKRVLIFGRKNRRVFDSDRRKFFNSLPQKIVNGFDFRVLFLDPKSPKHVLSQAYTDAEFPTQLRNLLSIASKTLSQVGIDPAAVCRGYRAQRRVSFSVVDDLVLYSAVPVDDQGRATPTTDLAFNAVNASTVTGKELIDSFESHWQRELAVM